VAKVNPMRALIIAVSMIAAPHGHDIGHDIHCGTNHACIERVAHRSCMTRHDPWHCRIWDRWQWRLKEAAERQATPVAAPDPAPAESAPTGFDQCVAFRESSGNPDAVAGPYWGLYQFDEATWAEATSAMGVDWPWGAASPAEQTAVFNYWVARDPGAWPNTVPPCGG
jgi:hypothetical protein